jgi:hypothetical protein
LAPRTKDQAELVAAIGDVIEIVTERSNLAHEAYRLITALRRDEAARWRRTPAEGRNFNQ